MNSNRKIIIVGYSGHAFVAIDILQICQRQIAGYCDVKEKDWNPFQLPYLGTEDAAIMTAEGRQSDWFVAIGENKTRAAVMNKLFQAGLSVVNVIHPTAVIAPSSRLGRGVMVAAKAVINPFCSVGDGAICNTACSIDHECVIADYAHIGPGAVLCGNVNVGKFSFLGAKSVVRQGIHIGADARIGIGAAVVKEALPGKTYAGVPATELKTPGNIR